VSGVDDVGVRQGQHRRGKEPGAWLPWAVVERVCRLDLRPPSWGRVFLATLLTSARFGGGEAKLTVGDLVRLTGLATRTVTAALAGLIAAGLVSRPGRYGRLTVNLPTEGESKGDVDKPAGPTGPRPATRGASLSAPPRCRQACTSPTTSTKRGNGSFW